MTNIKVIPVFLMFELCNLYATLFEKEKGRQTVIHMSQVF